MLLKETNMVSLRFLHSDGESRDSRSEGEGDLPSRSLGERRCENSSHVISW